MTLLVSTMAVSGCGASDSTSGGATPAAAAPAADVPAVPLQDAPPPDLRGRVAFQSDRDGRTKLYVLDLATGGITALTSGRDHRDEDPAWSPDGTMVAFATTRFGATYDLAVADERGGHVRQLTVHPAFERHPMWTADGRSLLFSSEQDGTQAVFAVRLDTGAIARVSPGPDRALMPAAGPGANHVTYTQGTSEGLQVVVHDSASGANRQITRGPVGAARGRWSPDGTRLAYTRLAPGASFLEILDLATGRIEARRVATIAKLDDAAWSPDGRYLIAAGASGTGEAEDWDLVLLPSRAPGAAHRLTSGQWRDRSPSWSPR